MKKVFVLGAGFTRAFFPESPLLTDDYDVDALLEQFSGFQYVHDILELEKSRNADGKINIERLMTRASGLMPYDFTAGREQQLGLLATEIRQKLVSKLKAALDKPKFDSELTEFARYCLDHTADCITFNYDDALEGALYQQNQRKDPWIPEAGYGFACAGAELPFIIDPSQLKLTSKVRVLKLHGSVNWRIKRGALQPYSVDNILHFEDWYAEYRDSNESAAHIEIHLEPNPFIVPPVLVKSTLVEEPVLRLVWSLARETLSQAEQITFIGYSMPVTDIAAGILFSESHRSADGIRVVDYAPDNDKQKQRVTEAYRNVFPDIQEKQFYFGGALQWVREKLSQ